MTDRTRTVTVDGRRVEVTGARVRLAQPGGWALGALQRNDGKKPPTWTATTEDGRSHTAHNRQLALKWLLDATAEERAVKDAEREERDAKRQAAADERAAEQARAAELATAVIRSVRPEYGGPSSFFGDSTFVFTSTELLDVLTGLLEGGSRELPLELALPRLRGRMVALCGRGPDAYDTLEEPNVWGVLVDAFASPLRDDEWEVEFVFEGRERAEDHRSIAVPCIGPTAVVRPTR